MSAGERRELFREIERYLAAVEVFRREGCEPRWAAERSSPKRRRRRAGSRDIP